MSAWSKRAWQCPYFRSDKKHCVHCEGGRLKFKSATVLSAYADRYCDNITGWQDCTLAKNLTTYYEDNQK